MEERYECETKISRFTGDERIKEKAFKLGVGKSNLKKSIGHLQQDVKFEIIKDSNFKILQMCQILDVSRSSYYDWLKRVDLTDYELEAKILYIFKSSRETYGINRIHAELVLSGINISRNKVARLKKKLNIYPKMKRKYKVTTDSNHNNQIFSNILNRDFKSTVLTEKIVSDITYISTLEGWLYLATTIDLSTRKVIGYSMSDTMDSNIIVEAITNGLKGKTIPVNAIFHSDRGSQYTSNEVKKLLSDLGIKQSMSRKGNCWDNAVAESFFKTLKYDGDIKKVFSTRQEARLAIFEFIEVFYNKKRRHSTLGYLTPNEAELLYSNILC